MTTSTISTVINDKQPTSSYLLLDATDATNFVSAKDKHLPDVSSEHLNQPSFDDLKLAPSILSALKSAGYTMPTPIQAQAIPLAIQGGDLLLSAQTGSGKTAAFVLPILHKLATNASTNRQAPKPIMAVILTPTRELAMQVQDNVRKYSQTMRGVFSASLVGGTSYVNQIRALKKGVQIIIATPGRFIDHLQSERMDLSSVEMLVLDEADRMLDMGFSDDINTILSAMPASRQTIMSSATWDGAVGKIAENYTNSPSKIVIAVESAHIDESVYFCDDFHHKNAILAQILQNPDISQAVIFASTKRSTEELAERLNDSGVKAHYLHGDLPQGKRNRIVADIKSKKAKFLIATDVAARGIDIAGISHVINYDLPRQAEDYVHRIGRSGRAGRSGVALNLCSIDDKHLLFAINRYLNRSMKIESFAGLEPVKNTGMERNPKQKQKQKQSKSTNYRAKNTRFAKRDERNTSYDDKRVHNSKVRTHLSDVEQKAFYDDKPKRTRSGDGRLDGQRRHERYANERPYHGLDNRSDKRQSFGAKATSAKPVGTKFAGAKATNVKTTFAKGAFGDNAPKKRQWADTEEIRYSQESRRDKKPRSNNHSSKSAQEIVFHTKSKRRFGHKD